MENQTQVALTDDIILDAIKALEGVLPAMREMRTPHHQRERVEDFLVDLRNILEGKLDRTNRQTMALVRNRLLNVLAIKRPAVVHLESLRALDAGLAKAASATFRYTGEGHLGGGGIA